jgi:hypothetical protein
LGARWRNAIDFLYTFRSAVSVPPESTILGTRGCPRR